MPPETVRELLERASRELAAAGVPEPRREARLLLERIAGIPRTRQLTEPDAEVPPADAARFRQAVARRAAREPFAYIVGRREFYGLELVVGPAVLVPRPETELLVDLALARLAPRRARPLRVLDIATGSGCILVALLVHLPRAFGVGTDLSLPALRVADANLRRHALRTRAGLVCTRWAEAVTGPLDLVVSNPPYVATAEMAGLPPEVRHEPRLALEAGPEGLAAYLAIVPHLRRLLAPDGLALLEIGAGRGGAVAGLARAHGLEVLEIRPDLAGVPRVVVLRRAERR